MLSRWDVVVTLIMELTVVAPVRFIFRTLGDVKYLRF